MSWAYKQGAKTLPAANVASGTIAATYPGPVTAGSLLVCFYTSDDNNDPTSLADSVNGAWSVACPRSAPTIGVVGTMYYFNGTAAGTPTVTVTYSVSASNRTLIIAEWTGQGLVPLDQSKSNATTTPTTTPTSTAPPLPSANGELFVSGLYATSDTVAITAGTNLTFTVRQSGSDSFANSAALEDAVQTTAAATAADWNMDQSKTYVCCLATFTVFGAIAPSGRMWLH
jgi:hypothetical protein